MSLVGLIDGLASLPVFQRLREQVASGRGGLTATAVEPAKPYVLAALWHGWTGPVVVVTPHPDDARRLVGELEAYCGDDAPIYQFAESELLPYERLSVETGTVHERIASLGALHGLIGGRAASDRASNGAGNPAPLIVASVTGLMQKTLPPDLLRRQTQTIRPDQKLSVEATLQQWARMAYRIGAVVDEPGTAARRGGIVDIFGPGHPASGAHRPLGRPRRHPASVRTGLPTLGPQPRRAHRSAGRRAPPHSRRPRRPSTP